MIYSAGVDLGNSNCVIAIPKGDAAQVVLNQSSNYLTPTMVTYSNERRYAGELSLHNQMQYPQSTITDLKKLINLKYDSHEREELSNSLPFKYLVKLEDGKVGIKVIYQEKECILRPEQCIAYLFKELKSYVKAEECENFVITINPQWSENQRRAIINSCRIANIKCSCLLNAPTAAAITYIMQHRQRLPKPNQKSVYVAFVDIGGSGMTVSISEVKQQSVQMKAITFTEKVSGSLLTQLFENYLIQKVKEKYHINPSENPRDMLRFKIAVEKAKKILSVNSNCQFEVHSIMNVDISFVVTRKEFNDQFNDVRALLEGQVKETLQLAKVKKEDIFELQLLGGTTRVVSIQNELKRIFDKKPKQSLNLDECFALGCAHMAACLSPKMRLPIIVKDISIHSLIVRWGENNEMIIFKKFVEIPAIQTIKIDITKSLEVKFFNEDDQIALKCLINTELDEKIKVSLCVQLNQSGTTDIVNCFYQKDGKAVKLHVLISDETGINDDLLKDCIRIENEMDKNDAIQKSIDVAKNDLEAQLLSINNLAEKNLYEFIDPSNVNEVKEKITQIQLWFEEKEFDRMPLEDYQSRTNELKDILLPAVKRMEYYRNSIDSLVALKNRAVELQNKYTNKVDPKILAHLTKFIQKIDDVQNTMKYKDVNFSIEKNKSALNILAKNFESMSQKK